MFSVNCDTFDIVDRLFVQVQIEVESCDKGGNFIGWMFIDGMNVSLGLVEKGLSKVHFTAERSKYYQNLMKCEDTAKAAKLNVR